jgi:hypothetical protein
LVVVFSQSIHLLYPSCRSPFRRLAAFVRAATFPKKGKKFLRLQ